ncbi:hypothetical protein ABW19_dt0201726 [Dactylella cylindrospora]|nr:hypothetical protein ABW19_dt0201726 [Dactylella cylindrospora]
MKVTGTETPIAIFAGVDIPDWDVVGEEVVEGLCWEVVGLETGESPNEDEAPPDPEVELDPGPELVAVDVDSLLELGLVVDVEIDERTVVTVAVAAGTPVRSWTPECSAQHLFKTRLKVRIISVLC